MVNDQHGDAVGVGELLQPCQRIIVGGIAAAIGVEFVKILFVDFLN